ncbi:hypothetical protein ACEPAH_3190 [Sanghuangporus vaninii]
MTHIELSSNSGKDESVPNQDLEVEETKDTYQDSSIHSTKDVLVISSEERRLVAKLDRRILPIVCLMSLFSYLDHSNVGNARLQGLVDDALHGDPTGALYDWVFSAFFFPYVLCQVPALVTSKLFPPHLWLGTAAVDWGLCSTLMVSFNFAGLLVARVGLGLFEACFEPGIPLYLPYYCTRHELGLCLAYYQSFATVAGAFSGLVAFGIQNAHAAIANWRLLFVTEVKAFYFQPDFNWPNSWLMSGLLLKTGACVYTFITICERCYSQATQIRFCVGGIVCLGVNCGFASISSFLPTIIKSFGLTNAMAQLLTVPPYAVARIMLIINSYASDRVQNRGFFIAAADMLWPVSCAFEFTSAFAAFILSASYILESRRSDRAFGKPTPEARLTMYVSVASLPSNP